MNVLQQIDLFNAGRDPERLAMKYRAMRTGPFAFLRGSCHLFYDRLPRGGVFKSAPNVWVCGDLHLENFGSYKGDNRLVYFDINDFDEAVLAPATWDAVRLLASLRVAAQGIPLGGGKVESLCGALVEAYAAALAQGKAYWVERDTAQGLVRELLDDLRTRRRASFLDSRTVLKNRRRLLRVDGTKALPASPAQRTALQTFMHDFAASQANPAFFNVLDVARRVAGTGSLGVERFVVLVEGKGSPDGNYLLDLKAALPSSLLARLKVPQPAWPTEAHRVVALQQRMQAVSMAFLQPVLFDEKPFVLRALQPSEDRVTVAQPGRTFAEIALLAGTLGRLVAWAQLRSAGRDGSASVDELIDFGQRKHWRAPLLAASAEAAAQVTRDAAEFDAAYDAGRLGA